MQLLPRTEFPFPIILAAAGLSWFSKPRTSKSSASRCGKTPLQPMHGANVKKSQPHDHHHGHEAIIGALHDCQVILCYGMGWRAAEDLKHNGIQAFVVQGETTPQQAVVDYLAGKLNLAGGFCRCQH